jgi:hypothetical protein
VARPIGRHGESRVAKVALIGAVTPSVLQTDANPAGVPQAAFEGLPAALAANRSEFYRAVPSGPFYNLASLDVRPSLVCRGCDDAAARGGCQPELNTWCSLYRWKKQDLIDRGLEPGTSRAEPAGLVAVTAEAERLDAARDTLRNPNPPRPKSRGCVTGESAGGHVAGTPWPIMASRARRSISRSVPVHAARSCRMKDVVSSGVSAWLLSWCITR